MINIMVKIVVYLAITTRSLTICKDCSVVAIHNLKTGFALGKVFH